MKENGFWTQRKISFNTSDFQRRFLNFCADLKNAGGFISDKFITEVLNSGWKTITGHIGLYGMLKELGFYPEKGWRLPSKVNYRNSLIIPAGWDFKRIAGYRSPSTTTPAMEILPMLLMVTPKERIDALSFEEYQNILEAHSNIIPLEQDYLFILKFDHWRNPAEKMAKHITNLIGDLSGYTWYTGMFLKKIKMAGAKHAGLKTFHHWSPADCLLIKKGTSISSIGTPGFVDWYCDGVLNGDIFPISQKLDDQAPKGSASIQGVPKASYLSSDVEAILDALEDLEDRGVLKIKNYNIPEDPDPSWRNYYDRLIQVLEGPFRRPISEAIIKATFSGTPPYWLVTPTRCELIQRVTNPKILEIHIGMHSKTTIIKYQDDGAIHYCKIRDKGKFNSLYVEIIDHVPKFKGS